jgi:hypothetical protein
VVCDLRNLVSSRLFIAAVLRGSGLIVFERSCAAARLPSRTLATSSLMSDLFGTLDHLRLAPGVVSAVSIKAVVGDHKMAATSTVLATATVILVHGAWADGSSWNKVISRLQHKSVEVVAVQNPFTSLEGGAGYSGRFTCWPRTSGHH